MSLLFSPAANHHKARSLRAELRTVPLSEICRYNPKVTGFSSRAEPTVRELVIIAAAFVALSAMARGNGHFVPRPTEPLPAVNVP
jgi:hypothetical protein